MSQLYKNNRTGNVYRQICISNSTATRYNWETQIVYQDIESGEVWSRKLNNFLEANTQIVEAPQQRSPIEPDDNTTPKWLERHAQNLTKAKTDEIRNRGEYFDTGVVLTKESGDICIIDKAAVRWLTNDQSWELMHPDANPPTPRWQEQWDELNRLDNPYWYMTKTKRTGNWELYTTENTFTADTPVAAIDAAYQSVIGSGVES